MFNGSENFNDDYFKALERVGATDLNGTTNEDRTNYFQNVPKSALDMVLWLESDRMGHLLGAIDQAKLDEQRGVVQNEKRQGENQPYAIAEELITEGGAGRRTIRTRGPSSARWTTSTPRARRREGMVQDLLRRRNAVARHRRRHRRRDRASRRSSTTSATSLRARRSRTSTQWIAKRTGTQRQIAQDRVPQARIYKVWNVPGCGTADADVPEPRRRRPRRRQGLAALQAPGLRRPDRHRRRGLVDAREIGSLFVIEATARPGDDLAQVEAAIDEELAKLLADGPDAGRARARPDALLRRTSSAAPSASAASAASPTSSRRARSTAAAPTPTRRRSTYVASATAGRRRSAPRSSGSPTACTRWTILPFPSYAAAADGRRSQEAAGAGASRRRRRSRSSSARRFERPEGHRRRAARRFRS